MRRAFLTVIVLLLLEGCIPKTHQLHLYTLSVDMDLSTHATKDLTLKVAYPSALNGIGGSRIFYSDNGKSGYYLYSRWSSSFNRLLYTTLLSNLQKSRKYQYVVGYGSRAKANRVLEVTVNQFFHQIIDEQSYAIATFSVTLIDSSGKVLKSKIFTYKTKLQEESAQAFVEGAKKSLSFFIRDLMNF